MVARQGTSAPDSAALAPVRIPSARLVVRLGSEPERMVLAPFATIGIVRTPEGGRAICLVAMDAPIAELRDRLTLLMGYGAPTVLEYLAERILRAAPWQSTIWDLLSASLPGSIGLAAGFVAVDSEVSGPDWPSARAACLTALAHDLLDAAQGFWREASCVGLWLPRTDPVQALSARPH